MRYAKTVDGGNVAFTVHGEGRTVIEFSVSIDRNIALDWEMPETGDWFQALARHLRLVRIEPRGLANSDPAPEHRPMLDYVMDDLDAVAHDLGVEQFALMTNGPYIAIALRYATTHPNAVRSLALHNPTTRKLGYGWDDPDTRSAYAKTVKLQAEIAGVDVVTMNAQIQSGRFAEKNTVDALERIMRTNSSPKADACWEKVWELHDNLDVSRYLPSVSQRTLITTDSPYFEPMARELATGIPGALLVNGTQEASATSTASAGSLSAADRQAQFFYGTTKLISDPSERSPSFVAGSNLTGREAEILALIAAGHSNPEIAEALVLSAGTVSRHVANIYAKLGIHNRAQATAVYFGVANEGSK